MNTTRGRQHEAASSVERQFRDRDLFVRLAESERAFGEVAEWPWRRGGVVHSAIALPHPHSAPFVPFHSLHSHDCARGGRQLDSFGHHRAACTRAGWLARRGFAG